MSRRIEEGTWSAVELRHIQQLASFTALFGAVVVALAIVAILVRRRPVVRVQALLRQGKCAEAGQLALETGLAHHAIDCFLAGGNFERAAHSALRCGKTELAAKLYEQAGDAKKAAALYEQVGRSDKAAALLPDPNLRASRTTALSAELRVSADVDGESREREDGAPPTPPPLLILPHEPSALCLEVLKRVKQLESLPLATGHVLKLLDDPMVSPRTVARELERDQQLATMVLRAANSAYYGASGQVRDVTAALVLIGFDSMKQLVVGRLSRQTLRKKNDRIQKVLWKHALATAVGAQAIARNVGGILPGHAFTSGLLHDLGKAVLYQAFPQEYAAVWAQSETDSRSSNVIETEHFGTDHAEVGAEMLRVWRLPAVYAITTLAHHTPRDVAQLPDEEARLRSSIVLASNVASWIGHGRFPARAVEEFPASTAMEELGADQEMIALVAASIDKDLAGYDGIFG